MNAPMTKAARQHEIRMVLMKQRIRSQAELAEVLEDRGVSVTQGRLSRDLVVMGATRLGIETGQLGYQVPTEGLPGRGGQPPEPPGAGGAPCARASLPRAEGSA